MSVAAGYSEGAAESRPRVSGRGEASAQLQDRLSTVRMRAHLVALQRIADRNGGSRVAGSRGYAASVRYVRDELKRAGYAPRVSQFPFVEYAELVERGFQLTSRARRFPVEAIDFSPSTPKGGVSGKLVSSDDGCEAGDFRGVQGQIALVRRGKCFFAEKAQNAGNAGAIALVVFNVERGPLDATLGSPRASAIPVVSVDLSTGRALDNPGTTIRLVVETRTQHTTSQNVVADARPRSRRVLLVGAHLDSVLAGPGVNDNGTGVAALLEIARVVRSAAPRLSVRFAFWGAEEFGLFGSRAYARKVDLDQIVGYLNFDMLGSREHRRAVYSGPFAARWLRYFKERGLRAETIDLSARSDNLSFEQRGIPTGGLFAGDDPCYHAPCDRVSQVDFGIFHELAAGAAFGVAAFAPKQ